MTAPRAARGVQRGARRWISRSISLISRLTHSRATSLLAVRLALSRPHLLSRLLGFGRVELGPLLLGSPLGLGCLLSCAHEDIGFFHQFRLAQLLDLGQLEDALLSWLDTEVAGGVRERYVHVMYCVRISRKENSE